MSKSKKVGFEEPTANEALTADKCLRRDFEERKESDRCIPQHGGMHMSDKEHLVYRRTNMAQLGFGLFLLASVMLSAYVIGPSTTREAFALVLLSAPVLLIGNGLLLTTVFGNARLAHWLPRFYEWKCALAAAHHQDVKKYTYMNRPKRLILIRHGQSIGNVDKYVYKTVPDHKLQLTAKGYDQAQACGRELKEIVHDENLVFFVSPYRRTKQTLAGILTAGMFDPANYIVREDPRLREQEFGNLQDPEKNAEIFKERMAVGRFWYRIPGGESGADVYDRITSFLQTMFREMDLLRPSNKRLDNVVVVSHGLAIRLLCMRYLHWTVQEFEQVFNPRNCDIWVLEKNGEGRYELVTDVACGASRDDTMTLSMRVPHREVGADLETYLLGVQDHYFESPLLSSKVIDPVKLAQCDPSEMRSRKSIKFRAISDLVELEKALSEQPKELDDLSVTEDFESDDDQEDSVFTMRHSFWQERRDSEPDLNGKDDVGMEQLRPTHSYPT